jgi:23S rRNA pseudouridine2605 synthase
MRVRYGPIIIPSQLKMGRWMMLGGSDLAALYEEVDLVPQIEAPTGRAAQRDKKSRPVKTKTRATKPARQKNDEVESKPRRAPRIRGH